MADYQRNLNPNEMFVQMAEHHTPLLTFPGGGKDEFNRWKTDFVPRITECLGEFPQPVDPNPILSARWEDNGLVRERWLIDVQPYLSASLLINIPTGATERGGPPGKYPAILCWHGHGEFVKEPVMGNRTTPELEADIHAQNYDYGEQMARAGYVTDAIDWIGAGEHGWGGNKSEAFFQKHLARGVGG